jgi:hypothetical protein
MRLTLGGILIPGSFPSNGRGAKVIRQEIVRRAKQLAQIGLLTFSLRKFGPSLRLKLVKLFHLIGGQIFRGAVAKVSLQLHCLLEFLQLTHGLVRFECLNLLVPLHNERSYLFLLLLGQLQFFGKFSHLQFRNRLLRH